MLLGDEEVGLRRGSGGKRRGRIVDLNDAAVDAEGLYGRRRC